MHVHVAGSSTRKRDSVWLKQGQNRKSTCECNPFPRFSASGCAVNRHTGWASWLHLLVFDYPCVTLDCSPCRPSYVCLRCRSSHPSRRLVVEAICRRGVLQLRRFRILLVPGNCRLELSPPCANTSLSLCICARAHIFLCI